MKSIIAMEEMDFDRSRDGYEDLLADIRQNFSVRVKEGKEPLFTTDASGLFETLLEHLPSDARQHYNCNACRSFVNHYGGLVTIDGKGKTTPAMWGSAPEFFIEAVDAVYAKVKKARVTGVFVTSNKELGTPVTGSWNHMAVTVPNVMIHRDLLRDAYQKSAEKAEEHKMLVAAYHKYGFETVKTAVNLLRSNSMYRSDKVLGVAEWFLAVQDEVRPKSVNATNALWKKAATAPTGYCHISSGMIGTLLDDIEAGLGLESVKRKFAEKMDPLQYQRPQAAPTIGNVQQAEKIVEKLGISNSLKRRFARLDEIQTIWKPRPSNTSGTVSNGVFAGIQTKGTPQKSVNDSLAPTVTMTWEKFQRTVLPTAKKIEYLATVHATNFSAIVTAEDPDAPPIIQWDSEENRNPFNWYVYRGGSYASQWNLSSGYCEVTGITLQPNMWQTGFDHHGKSAFFILKNCKDMNNCSSALFPEVLKSELHEIRATIEAYSHQHCLSGYKEASACGLRLQGNDSGWNHTFRVTTDVGVSIYHLDRWD